MGWLSNNTNTKHDLPLFRENVRYLKKAFILLEMID